MKNIKENSKEHKELQQKDPYNNEVLVVPKKVSKGMGRTKEELSYTLLGNFRHNLKRL